MRSEEAKSTAVFWSFPAKAGRVAMVGRKSCRERMDPGEKKKPGYW